MGKLIATTQATVDGVIDPVGEWVQPDGDHGVYSFERQARSSGLVLGRKTYEGLAGFWPSQSGKWADMVNAMRKYVGSTTLSGDLDSGPGPPGQAPVGLAVDARRRRRGGGELDDGQRGRAHRAGAASARTADSRARPAWVTEYMTILPSRRLVTTPAPRRARR